MVQIVADRVFELQTNPWEQTFFEAELCSLWSQINADIEYCGHISKLQTCNFQTERDIGKQGEGTEACLEVKAFALATVACNFRAEVLAIFNVHQLFLVPYSLVLCPVSNCLHFLSFLKIRNGDRVCLNHNSMLIMRTGRKQRAFESNPSAALQ